MTMQLQAKPSSNLVEKTPVVRGAQLRTTDLANAGVTVMCDIAAAIHPEHPQKLKVSQRLAENTLRFVYSKSNCALCPQFASQQIEGSKVRISFSNLDGKLAWNTKAPGNPWAKNMRSYEWEISADDNAYVEAQVEIDGQTVLVSNPGMTTPKYVRYAWCGIPYLTLYSDKGMPIAPFKTGANTQPQDRPDDKVVVHSSAQRVKSFAQNEPVRLYLSNGRLLDVLYAPALQSKRRAHAAMNVIYSSRNSQRSISIYAK